ncbi:MAG: CoA-binding protein [Gammaproteobacteria bacterium]
MLRQLRHIPKPVVACFRRADQIVPIAEATIAVGAKTLWMQLGVINGEPAERARPAGLQVVMDRCVKIEHSRLFGGLNCAGVNAGVISAKRPS